MADALTYRSNGSKRPMRRLGYGWSGLAVETSSLARASMWWFSEVSGSLLHAVVKYTLHRVFEQHYYRIISELFSSGPVLQNKVRCSAADPEWLV